MLTNNNLFQILEKRSKSNKIFFKNLSSKSSYTFKETFILADELSKFFIYKKINKILVLLPNCSEYIILYVACIRAGITIIPISIQQTDFEIHSTIKSIKPDFIFCEIERKAAINKFKNRNKYIIDLKKKINKFEIFNGLFKNLDKSNFYNLKKKINYNNKEFIIIFTSGTTGEQKGVVHSYLRLFSNLEMMVNLQKINNKNSFLNLLQFSYLGGAYNQLLLCLISEAKLYFYQNANFNNLIEFWPTLIKNKINSLWIVPGILKQIMHLDYNNHGKIYVNSKKFKKLFIGTAPLPTNLKVEFEKKYKLKIIENYGLTETLWLSCNLPKERNNLNVGKLFDGVKLKIKKRNKTDLYGEILVKTKYLFVKMFVNNKFKYPKKNKWFYTGDLGYIDKDKRLQITGRKKDIIIKNGLNISPKKIENAIFQNKNIMDCCVVGIKNSISGENILALISLKNNNIKTKSQLKKIFNKLLIKQEHPDEVKIIQNIPKNSNGKHDKPFIKKNY